MYYGDITTLLLWGFLAFIATTIAAIFSPFGIFYIIFSIIRYKSQDVSLKRISYILQIVFSIVTLVVGITISIFMLFFQNRYGFDSIQLEDVFFPIIIFFGVLFVFLLEIGLIIFEGYQYKGNRKN
jgi:hypothetical protein